MDPVHALTYASRAEPSLSDIELEMILLRSRALNAARGITGVLIKSDHTIVQYLEGPERAVARTLEAIERSPHHAELRVLVQAPAPQRCFDRWHMGFATFQPQHSRSTAHEEWVATLDDVRACSLENPALAALLAHWDVMAGAPMPQGNGATAGRADRRV